MLLGLIVALVPFTGFPGAWKMFFMVVAGLAIAGLAFLINRSEETENSDSFTENSNKSIPQNGNGTRPVLSDINPPQNNSGAGA